MCDLSTAFMAGAKPTYDKSKSKVERLLGHPQAIAKPQPTSKIERFLGHPQRMAIAAQQETEITPGPESNAPRAVPRKKGGRRRIASGGLSASGNGGETLG